LTTQPLSHSWARPTGERKARPLEGVAGTGKKSGNMIRSNEFSEVNILSNLSRNRFKLGFSF
jgi:hypothetical protein